MFISITYFFRVGFFILLEALLYCVLLIMVVRMVFPYEGIGSPRSEEIRPTTTWKSKLYILYVLIETEREQWRSGKEASGRLEIQFQLISQESDALNPKYLGQFIWGCRGAGVIILN